MKRNAANEYFPFNLPMSRPVRERLGLDERATGPQAAERPPAMFFFRDAAGRLATLPEMDGKWVTGGQLNMFALLHRIFRYVAEQYTAERHPGILAEGLEATGFSLSSPLLAGTFTTFAEYFPPRQVVERELPAEDFAAPEGGNREKMAIELFLLTVALENPALSDFRLLFDYRRLLTGTVADGLTAALQARLAGAPPYDPFPESLPELLRAPIKASPRSLSGQLAYIQDNWHHILPRELLDELLTAIDISREEEREFRGGPGRPQVLEFLKGVHLGRSGYEYPEYERYSKDADWMANVVMIAKMTYVWLDQLSKKYGRPVQRLDQLPDEELDILASWGFSALWLIGVWERSTASQRIKQIAGNPEAIASAYSLHDYVIAHDLGGEEALANLKERCRQRGIRLASDMVPNHTGIHSRWTVEHPDWFVQLDYPPYPAYTFNGPDLSSSPEVSLHIEDGYWDKRDAAVVFKHYDHRNGRTRFIYHGNDGTSTPWNDTAQLNYLLPELRETVIRTILHVARQFPIIRFDAAMTLAKKHYQRLWYPQPGHGSGVPSRAEHGMTREAFDAAFPEEFWREVVDRVAAEAPDTLLLAEAFWLMEGYFVRTLGMHRVYNSAFMNMLKLEENAKYRQTVKNVLEFDPEILKRFVNFMNNPDERTAIEQFGREGKYFGACVLLVTMPGLPMFGHGQIEGFHEKYGMEYRKAYWDEPVDEHLLSMHEERIFPLMRRRHIFSGSRDFVFYDFWSGSHVNEDVFAYSNRAGDERGVVLYHNRYAETKGWIRTSSAIAVKDGQGGTTLVQKSLGEALGFNPDGRCYYTFRDYASGLEYVRAGRELCEQGLYAELGAYQYCTFLDFREIWDDEYGTWGRLCHRLAGAPVPSVEEELKQVRYAGLIARFHELFRASCRWLEQLFVSGGEAELRQETLQHVTDCFTAFLAALGEQTGVTGDIPGIVGEVSRALAGGAELLARSGRAKDEKEALAFSRELLAEEGNRPVLFAALALSHIGELAEPAERGALAAEWLADFGLRRALEDVFRETSCENAPFDPGTAAGLVACLVRWRRFFRDWSAEACRDCLKELFADRQIREFLGVHVSGGVEWFNRERFELLVQWLYLLALLDREKGAAPDEAVSLVSYYRAAAALIAEAEAAGYAVARFMAGGQTTPGPLRG